jgi:hypothetical protein
MTDATDATDAHDVTAARRLDGNAAAGPLADLFAVDLTEARSRCASCGTTSMFGAHHLYADAPALVLRCPSCTAVVLRFAAQPGRLLLDVRGVQLLTVPVPVTGDGDGSADAADQISPAEPDPGNAPA